MSEPLVDVLITVFNGSSTIRSSIDSILNQTLSDIRIIIVDDGSTDDTVFILNKIAQDDNRVLIIQKPHSGIVDSVNIGLASCKAEFLARFDADDLSYPHRLATQVNYLIAHPACLAVSCAYIHIDKNGQPVGEKVMPMPVDQSDASWIPCREPFLLHPFLMMRYSSFKAAGGYRLCEVSEDSDLYWRLQELGDIKNLNEVLGEYRINPDSISSKSIVHGRRMALWSQLVGISAYRRRSGESDLNFDMERLLSYKQCTTLEQFCTLGSKGLTNAEKIRLRISASAKLVKLAHFRPFEIDHADCRFIRTSFIEGDFLLNQENRQELKSNLISCGMRLVMSGNYAEAYLLVKSRLPYVIVLAILRSILPDSWRKFLISSIRKNQQVQ